MALNINNFSSLFSMVFYLLSGSCKTEIHVRKFWRSKLCGFCGVSTIGVTTVINYFNELQFWLNELKRSRNIKIKCFSAPSIAVSVDFSSLAKEDAFLCLLIWSIKQFHCFYWRCYWFRNLSAALVARNQIYWAWSIEKRIRTKMRPWDPESMNVTRKTWQ